MNIQINFQKQKDNNLKRAVVSFLTGNGMSKNSAVDSVGDLIDDRIKLGFDCANNNYTRAIALLQLISSTEGSPMYIEYRTEGIYLVVSNCGNGDINKTIEYIDSCTVKIE